MRYQDEDNEDEAFDENGILRDGRSFHVNVKFADNLGRAVAKHANKQRVVDQSGNSGLALHRPGARLLSGGSASTQSAWDKVTRDAAEAYAADELYKQNAYKRKDAMAAEADDDDDLVEARKEGIRSELKRASSDDDEIENYLNNCDDDDVLNSNPDEHRSAFIAQQNGRDSRTAAVDKAYADYSRRQRDEWRRG